MSTVLIIRAHETAQPRRLERFCPDLVGNERIIRQLTLTPDLHEWLWRKNVSKEESWLLDAILAHLGEFALGEPVDDLHFMKRVEDRRITPASLSHGVWAIGTRFAEQYRFFGLFVIRDWFLALSKQPRDDLEKHPGLWHSEIDKCLRLWSELCPGYAPWAGDTLEEYLSNAEKLDDRW